MWSLLVSCENIVVFLLHYCREIVETMVKAYKQKVFNGQMPVFDGRKNLYSRDPLPIGREKVYSNVNCS